MSDSSVIDGSIRDVDDGAESEYVSGRQRAESEGVTPVDGSGGVDRWGRPVSSDRRLVTLDDGKQAWEYPGGGLRDVATGRILRGGGRIGIAKGDSRRAQELQAIGAEKLRAAVLEGAERAAVRLGVGKLPTDSVAAVVESLAVRAVESDNERGANEAAKVFLQALGILGGRGLQAESEGGGVTFSARFEGESARSLLAAVQAVRAERAGDGGGVSS